MLRELQATNEFGLRVEEKPGTAGAIVGFRAHQLDQAKAATAREVRQLLHLSPDAEEFKLSIGAVAASDKEIAMLTRSMMEIIAEASAEIPDSDITEGRATRMGTAGAPSDLGPAFSLRVRSSATKPAANEASAAVQYRNHWFWVDDRDLNAKRGLGFLMVLLTLAESGQPGSPPVLTISKP